MMENIGVALVFLSGFLSAGGMFLQGRLVGKSQKVLLEISDAKSSGNSKVDKVVSDEVQPFLTSIKDMRTRMWGIFGALTSLAGLCLYLIADLIG